MPICDICGKPVNVKKNHVYYHRENDDGTKSKHKTYEHVECANKVDLQLNEE